LVAAALLRLEEKNPRSTRIILRNLPIAYAVGIYPMFSSPRTGTNPLRPVRFKKEPPAAMLSSAEQIGSLENLRQFVVDVLCSQNQLEPGAFPVSERILVRSGRPCGLFFCLHGPRSVKFTAIWETEHNTVLFYDASGERTRKVRLARAPRLEVAEA
jgi:hypothetical protein